MKNNNKAILFIFITLLIDCTGIGIIIPVTPSLIKELIGGTISEASMYGGWLAFSYGIMLFLCSSIMGGLSDKYGRRPLLLMSLLGLGVDYIFLAWAPTIVWLFVGRIVAGMFGASFTTATAYIADISEPEKRAQNFGMIGAAFGIGFILGPLIGGVFSQFGTRVPFIVAAILSLLNLFYGYFVLPESLPANSRRAFDWKRANPISSLINLKKYKTILSFVVVIFLLNIAGHAAQTTWTYYTMYKFNWNEQWIGYSLTMVGFCIALVQGLLTRIVVPKFGQSNSIYLGLFFSLCGYLLFSAANQSWMMFAFIIPFTLGGIAMPAIQGEISNQVPNNEQGELQGALTSVLSLTAIIGPLLMTNVFYFFTKPNAPILVPSAPFLMGACLTIICAFIIYFTKKQRIKI